MWHDGGCVAVLWRWGGHVAAMWHDDRHVAAMWHDDRHVAAMWCDNRHVAAMLSPPLCSLPSPPPLPSSPFSPTSHEQPPPTAWEQWANDWAKEMRIRRIAEDLERLTLQYPVEPAAQATSRDTDDS